MHTEKPYRPMSGWPALVGVIAMFFAGLGLLIVGASKESPVQILSGIGLLLFALTCCCGFMAIAPNQSRVLLLFGAYKGSAKDSGFFWVNPFYSKKKLSLRVRNFETGSMTTPEKKNEAGQVVAKSSRTGGKPSKVNDSDGNPIDISAVVVWKVVDTAEAMFEVDDYENFMEVQSEAALRVLASRHPYDSDDSQVSLRGNTTEVCEQLKADIQERLDKAGINVIEARISHLAYAQEIAAAMLQRQQAQAVVAARTKIVEGAVGMVDMALDHLKRDGIVELDEDRKATMVSNLLVVLCSGAHTQPVVNTGTLYS
ncbi:SPFH domain-containing protein [Fuerstiella marisgermanici]|uniref:SPFH domain / Band 7 family protein n=1 Tax=Fuerstiella marisgermanici TaxID=1891926 RepID=A0A1P8WLW7_9PLAN|nr:SPFH domain-containing protein [Fuerstiella marisgermanici]APZ95062.1 SPFH domain / Band 7 family protein [Fuerstiella marisgermanici]